MTIPNDIPVPEFCSQRLFLTRDATHKLNFVSMMEAKQYARIVFTFPFMNYESYHALLLFPGSEEALNIYLRKRIMQYIDAYWPFKNGLQSEVQFNIMTGMTSWFDKDKGFICKVAFPVSGGTQNYTELDRMAEAVRRTTAATLDHLKVFMGLRGIA